MEEAGPGSPDEGALDLERKRFRVVAAVAAGISLPFVLAHMPLAYGVTVLVRRFAIGGPDLVPWLSSGVIGIVVMLAVDAGVFVLMYRLAKRYWIGLLYAPPLAYMGLSFLFWIGLAAMPLLYLPLGRD